MALARALAALIGKKIVMDQMAVVATHLAERTAKVVNDWRAQRGQRPAAGAPVAPGDAESGRVLADLLRRSEAAEAAVEEQAKLISTVATELQEVTRVLRGLSLRAGVALGIAVGAAVLSVVNLALLLSR